MLVALRQKTSSHGVARHGRQYANRYTDPFAEADEDTGEVNQSQNYVHVRIQRELRPFAINQK